MNEVLAVTSQAAALAALALFAAVMIYAALQDAGTWKIRNRVILVLLAGYALLAPTAGFALADIATSAACAGLVLLGTFAMFSFGWIGGGDAKLAAATALWLGLDQTLVYLFYTALLGGGMAAVLLAFRAVPLPSALQERSWISRLHSPATGLPYAVAMAPAALLVFPSTQWFVLLG